MSVLLLTLPFPRLKKAGQAGLKACLILFILPVLFPIGYNMTVWLEERHGFSQSLPDQVDGIVILGGAIESPLSQRHQRLVMNDAAERMSEPLDLGKRFPNARIIFTGGSGRLTNQKDLESTYVEPFYDRVMTHPERVIYESKSRNTYENARFTKDHIYPQPGQNWILVTSGWHMPRALAVFRHNGWPEIAPYATDPRTDGQYRVFPKNFNALKSYQLLTLSLRELLGLAVYAATGKIDLQSLQNSLD